VTVARTAAPSSASPGISDYCSPGATTASFRRLAAVIKTVEQRRNSVNGREDYFLEILGDFFFRHALDRSGAENFYDAGSCIDGRLTSAWNWCSSPEKKRYFHVFLLSFRPPLSLVPSFSPAFSHPIWCARVRRVRQRVVGKTGTGDRQAPRRADVRQ
jgi:hypothetical protein